MPGRPPRVLIIDDVFGRTHPDRRNEERANLCGQLLLEDVTGDEVEHGEGQRIKRPIAQAVFLRGQAPAAAIVGDSVENDLDGCLRAVRAGWVQRPAGEPPWSMVLLDLCFYTGRVTEVSDRELRGMPEGRDRDDRPASYFGLEILRAIRDELPDLPVVILSSKPRTEVSREIAARGALGFIARGEPGMRETLEEYLWRHGLLADPEGLIVGHSIALLTALRSARRVGGFPRSVLLRGEVGTGKELLASYLHRCSDERREAPFVAVDSGALTGELYSSELFGHRKGAFTGATADRTGRIVQANGGDLFLDEIANMPPDVQMGLLRVLQEQHVVPLGADRGQQVDVRFLSATNEDIEGKALLGHFRGDLLDRLRQGGTIALPALRERREDIPPLAARFLADALQENPDALVREIAAEAMELLVAHDWPGNIRALQSCVRRAVTHHPDVEFLYPHHFELPGSGLRKGVHAGLAAAQPETQQVDHRAVGGGSLSDAIATLDAFRPQGLQGRDIAGMLPVIQAAYARFVARLLAVALDTTRRPTPEDPEGKVLIHPAMKLLTGDSKLTATKAADLIKRLLSIQPESVAELLDDDPLREAERKARELRGGRKVVRTVPKRKKTPG